MSMPSPFEIGRAVSNNIGGAFQKQRDLSAIDEILDHAEQNGPEGDKIIGQLLARVSPERQPLALQIIQQQQAKRKLQKTNEAYAREGLDPNLPESLNKQKLVNNQKSQGHVQEKTTAQNSFNTMANLLKKGNLGFGSGVSSALGGNTAQDVGAFQSASGGLEAALVDMVSRGTLSNARFKYITETLLPKHTDTQAKIKGKLQSLASLLDLDPSELGVEQNRNQGNKGLRVQELTSNNAAENKGKRAVGDDGTIYRSDGNNWIPE